ncbi:MAG: hypothetical protein HY064_06240 [Bacteroidetes bacterium]|nr:hypothetical protein [Bacteroidota bacterium]
MQEQEEQLKALGEMRDLMNRSSRFLSLSGLSGICAGIFALVGAGLAWKFIYVDFAAENISMRQNEVEFRFYRFFFIDAGSVLIASLFAGWFFSARKAKKAGLKLLDAIAWRMLINLFIPLATGGAFCIALLYYGDVLLIAPATLIFYGLALLNAGKYTLNDIRYLGICEIILGLIATAFVAHGLFFWAAGFGVLHIVYGIVLWIKYERK